MSLAGNLQTERLVWPVWRWEWGCLRVDESQLEGSEKVWTRMDWTRMPD